MAFQMRDHCVEQLAKLAKSAFIAKSDLKDAFRIIPVSPLITDCLVSNVRD